MIADPHELQRLRYTPGQDLLARDFRDQAAYDEQLRWWHNRAMHGVFGVRYGLEVTLHSGGPGEPRVEVELGVAYDAFGRELILAPAKTAPALPRSPERATLVLVLRYRDDGGAHAAHAFAGAGCGAPAHGGAELAWVSARELRPHDGVPLARLFARGGSARIDRRFRPPAARPLARPWLGHGSTVAGATAWQPWPLGQRGLVAGLQVTIDTRAAGFTEPPCYFAWLLGGIETEQPTVGLRFFLPLSGHLAEQTLTSFRFRVLVFGSRLAGKGNPLVSLARRRLSVCWLGIQTRTEDLIPEVIHGHP